MTIRYSQVRPFVRPSSKWFMGMDIPLVDMIGAEHRDNPFSQRIVLSAFRYATQEFAASYLDTSLPFFPTMNALGITKNASFDEWGNDIFVEFNHGKWLSTSAGHYNPDTDTIMWTCYAN